MVNFSKDDVEIIASEDIHRGFLHLIRYKVCHSLFKGGKSKPLIREVLSRGACCAVVLYDPVLQKVVLIEQFRAGLLPQPEMPWLYEIVAGVVDEGETPEQAAIREVREEAGLEVQQIKLLTTFWSSPGAYDEKVFLYCAQVDASKAPEFSGQACETEDIRVHVMPAEEAFQKVRQQQITAAPAIIGLQWLELNMKDVGCKREIL